MTDIELAAIGAFATIWLEICAVAIWYAIGWIGEGLRKQAMEPRSRPKHYSNESLILDILTYNYCARVGEKNDTVKIRAEEPSEDESFTPTKQTLP